MKCRAGTNWRDCPKPYIHFTSLLRSLLSDIFKLFSIISPAWIRSLNVGSFINNGNLSNTLQAVISLRRSSAEWPFFSQIKCRFAWSSRRRRGVSRGGACQRSRSHPLWIHSSPRRSHWLTWTCFLGFDIYNYIIIYFSKWINSISSNKNLFNLKISKKMNLYFILFYLKPFKGWV